MNLVVEKDTGASHHLEEWLSNHFKYIDDRKKSKHYKQR